MLPLYAEQAEHICEYDQRRPDAIIVVLPQTGHVCFRQYMCQQRQVSSCPLRMRAPEKHNEAERYGMRSPLLRSQLVQSSPR